MITKEEAEKNAKEAVWRKIKNASENGEFKISFPFLKQETKKELIDAGFGVYNLSNNSYYKGYEVSWE